MIQDNHEKGGIMPQENSTNPDALVRIRGHMQPGAHGVLEGAIHWAGRCEHSQVDAIHLLFSLVVRGNNGQVGAPPPSRELCIAGASRGAMVDFFNHRPELVAPQRGITPTPTHGLLSVLSAAERRAKRRAEKTGRMGISQEDLLVSLLRSGDTMTTEALNLIGVDQMSLLRKFDSKSRPGHLTVV